jgi:hypothetical protein
MHALGMQEKAVFAAAFPMAGGLAMQQGTCGAVVGGMLCLGMASRKYGRPWDEFNTWGGDQVLGALNAVRKVYEQCADAMGGTTNCREIIGMELKTVEDAVKFGQSPSFETCCQNCGTIARIVVEALLEDA